MVEERRIKLSDLAMSQEAEIKENPYRFLGISSDAGPEEIRGAYISLAKRYHPDLVNPKWDSLEIKRLYTQKDLEYLGIDLSLDDLVKIVEDLNAYARETAEVLVKHPDQKLPEISLELEVKIGKAKDALASLAHTKTALLNRAYEEIKSRHGSQEWNVLFGYDVHTRRSEECEEFGYIDLEGRGEVVIIPENDEFFVPGPHLSFDFGPDYDHSWEPWDYRYTLNLKHLFAHMEIGNGELVNHILLQPFIDCFDLNEQQAKAFREALSANTATLELMKMVGVSRAINFNYEKDRENYLRSLRFHRQVNEILYLDRGLGDSYWIDGPSVKIEVEDGKLTLEDFTRTTFSETDYILFLTLAYGPLLT